LSTPVPRSSTAPPRRGSALFWLLALLLLAAAGWFGWRWWQAQSVRERNAEAQSTQRIAALEARTDALRQDQRAQSASAQR